jgi:Flp pilus assembly protein TadB
MTIALAVTGAHSGGPRSSLPLTTVLFGVFVAISALAMLLIGTVRPDDRARRMADRIGRYGSRHAARPAEGTLARFAGRWVAPLLKLRNAEPRLAQRLDVAGIKLKPAEWVLLGGCVAAALALGLTVLSGSALIGIAVGCLAGWLGMRVALNFRVGRRRARFGDQLPDVLQFVAGSLRSGFSLAQGLDAAAQEDIQPAAGEFARALAESRIGIELEDTLDTIADRMESGDLRWAVIAIRIQREVGGNLAEVLGHTVDTMRERSQLRRHVRGLSAEGRLSAYILVCLPIFVGTWIFLTRRAYVRPLYTTPLGLGMLGFAAVMIVGGALWMRKLVKVEV